MIKPTPAQLAVLIHYDGGPTAEEQGYRPNHQTISNCREGGWLEASAEEYPRDRRTTDAGRAVIRMMLPDYVSPGTAPRPTAFSELRTQHPRLVAMLDEHAAGVDSAAERIAEYVLALAPGLSWSP